MKTRITRYGTLHYLECVDCGTEKTTRSQMQKPLCKLCGHKHRRVESKDREGIRECRLCKKRKPATNEHYHWHTKSTGKLKTTCKPCDTIRKSQWNKDNAERHNEHNRRTFAKNYKKYRTNPVWVMKRRVSSAVSNFLSKRDGYKSKQTFEALPYTPEQLVEHLENQFDDKMTWDNYGSYWSLDHIYPQSKLPYDSLDHPNFIKCWALENLRPLEATENLRKGNRVLGEGNKK